MSFLPVKKRIPTLLLMGIMVFAWIITPLVQTHGCVCSSGHLDGDPGVPQRNPSLLVSACCCTGPCSPGFPDDTLYGGNSSRSDCDAHGVCCCRSKTGAHPSQNQAFLKHDRRAPFQELQVQDLIPTDLSSETDPIRIGSIWSFTMKMARIPHHLSSTVLLI